MSFTADRVKGGIWPLQFLNYKKEGFDLDLRTGRYAARIERRLDKKGELGHYKYEDDTFGDVIGGYLWLPVSRAGRLIPAWSFAWPTVLIEGPGKTPGRGTGGTVVSRSADSFGPSSGRGGGSPILIPKGQRTQVQPRNAGQPMEIDAVPLFDDRSKEDLRFETQGLNFPDHWPEIIPAGTFGIVLDATDETRQIPVWFHCDPTLIAPNQSGDFRAGSLMADLTTDNRIDLKRMARMQTAFRVVRIVSGCIRFDDDENSWAFQIGRTGLEGSEGLGQFYDVDSGGLKGIPDKSTIESVLGTDRSARGRQNTVALRRTPKADTQAIKAIPGVGKRGIVGLYGVKGFGPFDNGDKNDKHKVTTTKDGEDVNSGHLQTEAYYKGDGVRIPRDLDAPLDFDTVPYSAKDVIDGLLIPVFLRMDHSAKHLHACKDQDGRWRWEAEIPLTATGAGKKMTPYERYKTPDSIRSVLLPEKAPWGGGEQVMPMDSGKDTGLTYQYLIDPKPWAQANALSIVYYFNLSSDKAAGDSLIFFFDQREISVGDKEPTTFGTHTINVTQDLKANQKYFLIHHVTESSPIEPVACDEFWLNAGRLGVTDSYTGSLEFHVPFLVWSQVKSPGEFNVYPAASISFPIREI